MFGDFVTGDPCSGSASQILCSSLPGYFSTRKQSQNAQRMKVGDKNLVLQLLAEFAEGESRSLKLQILTSLAPASIQNTGNAALASLTIGVMRECPEVCNYHTTSMSICFLVCGFKIQFAISRKMCSGRVVKSDLVESDGFKS